MNTGEWTPNFRWPTFLLPYKEEERKKVQKTKKNNGKGTFWLNKETSFNFLLWLLYWKSWMDTEESY